ncbi:E3 ubiquitin-protein ligase UPL5-like [Lotus japonicus]|uniref:E3 ubiquitin-protein ligase UPL5-like n=1 Tax=Lotus japonicus TaxID=34305 RepID=UPI00258A1195|nr:E3 ubiquitin-protein ligase UPL5-like [Lotus japonicus]
MENLMTLDHKQKMASLAPRLQFFIRMIPNGNCIVMQGSAEESVKSVYQRVESRTRIPIHDQRLIHAGKQLRWEQRLGDCGIQNDATLHLVAYLRSGGDISRQRVAVDDMLDLWHLSDEGSSTKEHCVKMLFKLNALDDFMYKRGLKGLVSLYRSESSPHKAMADFTIRLFLDGCNSMFKKGLHACCLRTVAVFCDLLRIYAGDDCDLYNSFMTCLRIVLEECVGDINPNRKVLVKSVLNYVGESVNLVLRDLDSCFKIKILELSLMYNFQNLIAFLVCLRDAIKVKGMQAWETQSGTNEEDDEEPLLANEIYHLRLMYSKLLYKMEEGFQKIEDDLDNVKQWTMKWVHYFTLLKHMSELSKLIDGAEEMFREFLIHRGRNLSVLVILYTTRGEGHEWILEHKSALNSAARRQLAVNSFPSEEHGDEETHHIFIDRSNLLAESFREIVHARLEALRYDLSVNFLHEEGAGEGVEREWFILVCQEIFNPLNALFVACPNDCRRFFPNPASKVNPLHLEYFTFSGRIIALALMNEVQVGIAFDRVFFKQLAGEHITLEDIQEADPYMYRSCKKILEMDADFVDSDALGLTFAWEAEELGHKKVIELCPGGESLVVNSKNRQKYVDLLIQNQFVSSISEQVSHFSKGFGDIIFNSKLRQFFQILDLKDFDRMLYGEENAISVEEWKAKTEYVGYRKTDPQISWFWEVVRKMSAEERKILLFFWTSLKYLPSEGFDCLAPLKICRSMEPDNHLPSSHTCIYQLRLPPYSSMAVMQDHFTTITTQEYVYCTFGYY